MKEKTNQNDTVQTDLQDYFSALEFGDEDFLRGIMLTTASPELRKRIDERLAPKQKQDCKAEVIQLRY